MSVSVPGAPSIGEPGMSVPSGVASLFASINSDGWSAVPLAGATYTPANPNGTSPDTTTLVRQGFDTSGNATTYTETLVNTARVRLPYGTPPAGSTSADPVLDTSGRTALSDYVYSTDTIAGTTNNSTVASPPPIAQWAVPDRTVVGDSISGEIVAFHRNGRNQQPVAAIVVRATDGTNTVSTVVNGAPQVSGRTGDVNAVLVYKFTLDITALADSSLIKLDAKVYPWIGGAASVLDSANQTNRWDFSTRWYRKDTARFASPQVCYIDSVSGSDTTGKYNDPAHPYATLAGAINNYAGTYHAGNGVTAVGGTTLLDGVTFYFNAGTHSLTGPLANAAQQIASIILTPSPGQSASTVTLRMPGSFNPEMINGLAAGVTSYSTRFTGCKIQRGAATATFVGYSTARGEYILDNCVIDPNTYNSSSIFGNYADIGIYGLTEVSAVGGILAGSSAGAWLCVRGADVDLAGNTAGYDSYYVIGSRIRNAYQAQVNTSIRVVGGVTARQVFAFNSILSPSGTNAAIAIAQTSSQETTAGAAVVQNLFEWDANLTTGAGFAVSNDNKTDNTTHVVIWNNTFVSAGTVGRWNVFYDENTTVGIRRSHILASVRGNVISQRNHKSDLFCGENTSLGATESATRVGSWSVNYGVGWADNWDLFVNAAMSTEPLGYKFGQEFSGLRDHNNNGQTTYVLSDPGFTNYQAVTVNTTGTTYTAGAGGGDYHITTGGPAKGVNPASMLPVALDGAARSASADTIGCYA